MTTPPVAVPVIVQPQLPDRYTPFKTLYFCSNILRDVLIPIQVNGYPAFLVGRGKHPLLWLAAPVKINDLERTFIVRENVSINPAVHVVVNRRKAEVAIVIGAVRVLVVRVMGNAGLIDQIDLRPVGLDVWGDKAALHIGGGTFGDNTIAGSTVAFALGSQP